jgi:serine/threonine protein kinase
MTDLSQEQRQYMTTQIISEGAYGCAVYPGVKCDNTTEGPNYLTKVQLDGPTLQNENRIGQAIIEKYGNRHILFYAPILASCNIEAGEIQNDEIKKCKILQQPETTQEQQQAQPQTYVNSKIRYIGKTTLNTLFKTLAQSPQNPQATPPTTKIVDLYLYLTKSIQMLLDLDIVHFDIKDNNIMYDHSHHVPVLIDFGLSRKMSLAFDESAQFFQTYDKYIIWSTEIFLISRISKKQSSEILTEQTTQELIDLCMTNIDHPEGIYQKITLFDPAEIETYKANLQTFLKTYTGYSYSDLHDKLMETYKTWDLYSTSATFLFLIHTYFRENIPNELNPYIDIFKSHILASPLERDSVQDTETKLLQM